MITPQEYEGFLTKVIHKDLEQQIDSQIKEYRVDIHNPWIEVTLVGEYSAEIRHEIAKKYLKGGWFKICHNTSSECFEKPGFTNFVLCTEKMFGEWVKNVPIVNWHIL